ncbi:hypothetical protein PTSG_02921 [Salpingoeca rosetta]|uniref:N-acetylgalactosaminide beta-1,3-galactosyltransferase n=1 Tax=Salpingoeca rosetta (strain ATCC 50818 / BSB-021) TaxID=946362 RepID=F2U3Q7_SALR5|nr:uncharacterized protein PTSG_02921 [Salpingoeca rosetta]EGD82251.1 hypothetical protein PTSG_02921 [Salpingoeca rosetta]|eukprot:XP_004996434.1 hypothetical protein PTSG_02921 [Salpingoeca rosetta]
MPRLLRLGEYERLVVLVLFLSLGITIGMMWAHSSCNSGPQVVIPAPRRMAQSLQEVSDTDTRQQRASAAAQPNEEEVHNPPNEQMLQAIEALELIQQRHQGPDDDDAVANVIARELFRRSNVQQAASPKQAAMEVHVNRPGNNGGDSEQQQQRQHGQHAKDANANAVVVGKEPQSKKSDEKAKNKHGASDDDAAADGKQQGKASGPTLSPVMRDMIKRLGLDSKVDMGKLLAQGEGGEDVVIKAGGNKDDADKPQEPVPAYMLNTMPDEPPYGTPPDANPKKGASVFALVLTTPQRHDPKAIAVNRTWGGRFDGLAFMTSEHFQGLNTVIIPIKDEDRKDLWLKTRLSLLYAYTHFLDKYDWFMKLDDDSYVMVDNLRSFLDDYDPDRPHFFGRRFLLHRGKKEYEMSYHSGGAGYILSRRALKMLGDNADKVFRKNGVAEDVEIARSLAKLNIHCEDTRDSIGRERFLPLNVQRLRYDITKTKKPNFWYWRYTYYPPRDELECCSVRWITTHYVYSKDMYTLDRLHKEGKEAAGKDPATREW